MSLTFYWYPKCGTCRNARKWLEQHNIAVEEVHIVEQNPNIETLKAIQTASGQPLRKLFNTSGMKYRELQLKDKLPTMTEEEMFELLASDGMLVKRPLLTDGTKATIGFKEDEYASTWK